jgi:hypothetical protein
VLRVYTSKHMHKNSILFPDKSFTEHVSNSIFAVFQNAKTMSLSVADVLLC